MGEGHFLADGPFTESVINMPGDVVHTNFHFQIPDGKILSKLSTNYPSVQFNLQSLLPMPNSMGMGLIQVKGGNLQKLVENLSQWLPSSQFTVFYQVSDEILLNLWLENPWFLLTVIKTNLILKYPIIVQNNRIHVDLVADRIKIDTLFQEFDAHKISYVIRHIGRFSTTSLLTTKQEEVLKAVLNAGYFEIPRRKSLSVIAAEIGVSPASLSEMLRRIFRHLSLDYFAPMELNE